MDPNCTTEPEAGTPWYCTEAHTRSALDGVALPQAIASLLDLSHRVISEFPVAGRVASGE